MWLFRTFLVAGAALTLCSGDSPPLMEVFNNDLIDNHMVLQSDIESQDFKLECPYHKSGEAGENEKFKT